MLPNPEADPGTNLPRAGVPSLPTSEKKANKSVSSLNQSSLLPLSFCFAAWGQLVLECSTKSILKVTDVLGKQGADKILRFFSSLCIILLFYPWDDNHLSPRPSSPASILPSKFLWERACDLSPHMTLSTISHTVLPFQVDSGKTLPSPPSDLF